MSGIYPRECPGLYVPYISRSLKYPTRPTKGFAVQGEVGALELRAQTAGGTVGSVWAPAEILFMWAWVIIICTCTCIYI
jgi:hypothetical protein